MTNQESNNTPSGNSSNNPRASSQRSIPWGKIAAGVMVVLTTVVTGAFTNIGESLGEKITFFFKREEIELPSELKSSQIIKEPKKDIVLPQTISTNGHSLNIDAHTIKGTGTIIRAFEEEKAANGENGADGADGTNESPGSNGSNGNHGEKGEKGKDSGEILITAKFIEAPIKILNNAQYGGTGGTGGKGGIGGQGGQGKPSKTIGVDCKEGGGDGASGGIGGNGGNGGNGGDGGNAGNINIKVKKKILSDIDIKSLGGKGGKEGEKGEAGTGGQGGDGGKSTGFPCRAGNRGSSGSSGKPGTVGKKGRDGSYGKIKAEIGSKNYNGQDGKLELVP